MRTFLFICCVILGYSVSTPAVYAAVLSVDADQSILRIGDLFTAHIILDTEGETINTFGSTLIFPETLLEYIASDDSHSVVNMWVEAPTFYETNHIRFAGITPGGVRESAASIITLTFKVIGRGQATIGFLDSMCLRSDGVGNEVPLREEPLHISVIEGVPRMSVNIIDDEMPEYFNPEIMTDPDVFNGESILLFSTKDKGSGIRAYEVREGFLGRYHIATSPYKINQQMLDKRLYVKAIDQMGNERVMVLYPQDWRPWYKDIKILGTIVILCVLVLFVSIWRLKLRLQH